MTLDLTVHIWREENQYIAHAMPLDVMTSGATPQQARDAIDEAVRCFVKTAEDAGTLEQLLEECGYRRQNGQWTCPDWVGIERHAIAL